MKQNHTPFEESLEDENFYQSINPTKVKLN